MKSLLSIFFSASLLAAFATSAIADIQAPPMAQQDPIRKLGRGISNIAWGVTELPNIIAGTNETEGNSAALGFGIVLGTHRSVIRITRGVFDVLTWPVPLYKGSFRPPFHSALIWGHNGYSEFPPELGFETRYNYAREYSGPTY